MSSRLACFGYAVLLALATLGDGHWDWRWQQLAQAWQVGLLPAQVSGRDWLDGLRNLLLFAGWGLVYVLSRTQLERRTIWQATLWGGLFSLLIELTQLFSTTRISSGFDLLSNLLGAWIGSWLCVQWVIWRERTLWRRRHLRVPAWMLFAPLLLAGLCQLMFPLARRQMLEGLHGTPLQRLDAVWQHGTLQPLVGWLGPELLWCLLLPPLLLASLRELDLSLRGQRAALWLLACLLGPLAENLRALAGLPVSQLAGLLQAVLVLVVAEIGLRPRLTAVLLRRRFQPLVWLLASLLLILLWRGWSPWVWVSWADGALASGRYFVVPLAAQLQRVELLSSIDIIASFSLYCALAMPLATWRRWRSGVLLMVLFALLIEGGQIWLAGRYFDTTDVLIPWAGLYCGLRLVRLRAGPQGRA